MRETFKGSHDDMEKIKIQGRMSVLGSIREISS